MTAIPICRYKLSRGLWTRRLSLAADSEPQYVGTANVDEAFHHNAIQHTWPASQLVQIGRR
jgi:hypothetical protein